MSASLPDPIAQAEAQRIGQELAADMQGKGAAPRPVILIDEREGREKITLVQGDEAAQIVSQLAREQGVGPDDRELFDRRARRLTETAPIAIAAMSAMMATGSAHAHPAPSRERMPERVQPRRIATEREVREAAQMASEGIPIPGTNAERMIQDAENRGDFTAARELRESIKALAPKLVEEADRLALEAKLYTTAQIGNVTRVDRAEQKRRRKAERNVARALRGGMTIADRGEAIARALNPEDA